MGKLDAILGFAGPLLGWLKEKSDGNPKTSAATVGGLYSFFDTAPWKAFWAGVAKFSTYMAGVF